MKVKKILLVDVDEVICFSGLLDAINEFLGSSYVIDDFSEYYIDKVAIPKERFDEFQKFLNGKNLYENAQILPYAKEVLEKLNCVYETYICSSCINPFNILGSGRSFEDKYNFLINSFPFIVPYNFIFTDAKHLIKAHIQIDDRLSKLSESIETKILFPSYHNKNIQNDELASKWVLRAGYNWTNGWPEVAKILL